jgi:ATP-dependent Clp protease ATP-binding subunit ClpC
MDEYFSRDLTQLAADGKLGPFCGRGTIIDQAIAVLSQDGKANLVLTGEPGVGKTAVIEAIALKLSQENSPAGLRAIHIKELDTNALASGTMYAGSFEAKLKVLVDYLRTHRDVVVFVDEIHALLGVLSDENRPSPFANFLKPYLARGEIRMIGATTNHEFEVMNKKDAALTRRFVRIDVPEPTREEAIVILRQLGVQRTARTGVALNPGVVEAIVDACIRYVHDRRLPDKAIDLLTACMAKKSVPGRATRSVPVDGTFAKMIGAVEAEIRAIEQEDWKAAARMAEDWFETKSGSAVSVTVADVQAVVHEKFGGIDARDRSAIQKILGLEQKLQAGLVGQQHAISAVCAALKRMLALGQSVRPIGSFLFLGPTGVGKTELCRTVADRLWGDGSLLQYNMSEYMERHEASKLIGSPPGYQGSDQGGRLVREVAARPASVVLFDEIEKAHTDIHNLLLQILEEGKLQDGTGKTCAFSQSLVMLTSNVCADLIGKLDSSEIANHYEDIRRQVTELLKKSFRPEIINRIDEIVIFSPLTRDELERILDLLIAAENVRLRENDRPAIELTAAARRAVLERGFDPTMGARPLRRSLQQLVLTKLADFILQQAPPSSLSSTSTVVADWDGHEIRIAAKETRPT